MSSREPRPLLLGIDTGGTYTDAVIMHADVTDASNSAVMAKAKTLTTHHDLLVGVAAAIEAVLGSAGGPGVDPSRIGLVSLSTTLATNALVEGQGSSACLVVAGFGEPELARLEQRVAGEGFLATVAGGHDALGVELAPVDDGEIAHLAASTVDRVAAYAVATQFSVRNPSHERMIADALTAATGHPVTCSHELASRLDGPRRALTALLNARLLGMIARLERAVRTALAEVGIAAPLMMVKGDGTLATAEVVARRPIETILSGPAASVVGAHHLAAPELDSGDRSGSSRVIVVDVGGTTTDVAAVVDGSPTITADGALVAGHHTMVDAVDLATSGLGGDSEVRIDAGSGGDGDGDGDEGVEYGGLAIGPARALPLSRVAASHPGIIPIMAHDLASPSEHRQGRFYVAVGEDSDLERDDRMGRVLASLADGPRSEFEVVGTSRDVATVQRLRDLGVVRVATLTPTDAAVLLGWLDADADGQKAAALGAGLLARRRDRRGVPQAESPSELAARVVERFVARSASLVVEAARRVDGFDPAGDRALLHAGLRHHRGFLAVDVALDATLVAVGAAAGSYYPLVAERLGARLVVPDHSEVANAVGAAVGEVRVAGRLTITRPRAGRFDVHGTIGDPDRDRVFSSLDEARAAAGRVLTAEVRRRTVEAGADPTRLTVTDEWMPTTANVAGRELLVEAVLTVTAAGPPMVAGTRSSGR